MLRHRGTKKTPERRPFQTRSPPPVPNYDLGVYVDHSLEAGNRGLSLMALLLASGCLAALQPEAQKCISLTAEVV
jgi:hypothetical protein